MMEEQVILSIPIEKKIKEQAEAFFKARGMTLEQAVSDFLQRNTKESKDLVWVLETNVDDCSGEQLGYTLECLLEAGALDACCFPVYMKKNRPAYLLQVLCREENLENMEEIIFRETTSIGLRRYQEERKILPRTFQDVCLSDGQNVRVKVCSHHGQKFFYPEYETVKKVCKESRRAFREIYAEAAERAEEEA